MLKSAVFIFLEFTINPKSKENEIKIFKTNFHFAFQREFSKTKTQVQVLQILSAGKALSIKTLYSRQSGMFPALSRHKMSMLRNMKLSFKKRYKMNFMKDYLQNDFDMNDYEDIKKKFAIKVPENFNFAYDIVDRYAKLAPQKEAMLWVSKNDEARHFTFKEMSENSNRCANFLTSLGIKKGDAVMLILRRRWEFWPILLALHKIGAVAVPATNQLLAKDIEYRTNAAEIKLIISVDENHLIKEVEKAMPASKTVRNLVMVKEDNEAEPSMEWIDFKSEFEKSSTEFERPSGEANTQNSDIMLRYFTSGTSGYPKMVQHNFTYPLGHITTAKFWQNVIDDGLHLSIAETGWAKAMWGKLYGQWICGTSIFVYDMMSFKPAAVLRQIEKHKVTTFCAPPTVYRYLVRTDLSKYDLSSLKYCVTAGEALNAEVYNKFYEMTGMKMFEGYGQTETTILAGNFPGMEPKPGSMGKPAPGYNLEIVDSEGKKCSPGETGSIILRFDGTPPTGVFSGYYKDEELTQEAFKNGIYHTGDTAYSDEDGYIWFVGRDDDLIKSTGYRISPFEVESVFQQHPKVLECAVTGIPDKHRGQAVKATVVLTKGTEPTEELRLEILNFVKERTASYKHPRVIEFVDELPKTISGKIRRVEIRENDK